MMPEPPLVVLVPGMGSDERLFSRLQLPEYPTQVLKFIPPLPKESLQAYARRLLAQVPIGLPIAYVGVSLGGMLALEMDRVRPGVALVLISSAKTVDEFPSLLRLGRKLKAMHWLALQYLKPFSTSFYQWMGRRTRSEAEYKLVDEMFRTTPNALLAWQGRAVLGWQNRHYPTHLIHIHGTQDHLLPARHIKGYLPIVGGTHIMVLRQAALVSQAVVHALQAATLPHTAE